MLLLDVEIEGEHGLVGGEVMLRQSLRLERKERSRWWKPGAFALVVVGAVR